MRNAAHGLAFALLALATTYLVTKYGDLPEKVPLHFGPSGHADSWGSKVMLWILPAVGVSSWALLWFLRNVGAKYINTPVKITDENREIQLALAHTLLARINLVVSTMFAFLTWKMVASADSPNESVLGWPFFALLAAMVIIIGSYFFAARKHR